MQYLSYRFQINSKDLSLQILGGKHLQRTVDKGMWRDEEHPECTLQLMIIKVYWNNQSEITIDGLL